MLDLKDTFISGYNDSVQGDFVGREVTKPKFGDRLRNGATVIEYKHVENGQHGWYPHGYVLARKRHGIGDYVVWTAICDFRGDEWYCENGHYFEDIASAAKFFKEA